MFHYAVRAVPGTLLFHDWPEGVGLWQRLVAVPGLTALVAMPDHVHLLHPLEVQEPVRQAMRGYARWRNARRGTSGPVFAGLSGAEPIVDEQKRRRAVRYVHLNPCRAGLCPDPLSWPLSTHRDAVGLSLPGVVPVRREPARFHRYVSSDPHVDVAGTALPVPTPTTTGLLAVRDAVSAVTRTPLSDLRRRGEARTLWVRASVALCPTATRAEVAALAGISARAVRAALHGGRAGIDVVARALHDERFGPLHEEDLRRSWSALRRSRIDR